MTTAAFLDRRVHRCCCGAWVYAGRCCQACALTTGAPMPRLEHDLDEPAPGRRCSVCGGQLGRDDDELCRSCLDQLDLPFPDAS